MSYIVLVDFTSQKGVYRKGDTVELPENEARLFMDRKLIETKIIKTVKKEGT